MFHVREAGIVVRGEFLQRTLCPVYLCVGRELQRGGKDNRDSTMMAPVRLDRRGADAAMRQSWPLKLGP